MLMTMMMDFFIYTFYICFSILIKLTPQPKKLSKRSWMSSGNIDTIDR